MRFTSLSLLTILGIVAFADAVAGSGSHPAPESCLIGEPVVCVPFNEGTTISHACRAVIATGIITKRQTTCEHDVVRAIAPMNPTEIPRGYYVPIPISIEKARVLQKNGQRPEALERIDALLAESLKESRHQSPQQAPSFPERSPENPGEEGNKQAAENALSKVGLTEPGASVTIICADDSYEVTDSFGAIRPDATNRLIACITEQQERIDTLQTRVNLLEEKEGDLQAALLAEQEGGGIAIKTPKEVNADTWRGIAISAMVIAALMAVAELGQILYRRWQMRHPTEKPVRIPTGVIYCERAFPDAHIDVPAILKTTWLVQPPCTRGWLTRKQIAAHFEQCETCKEYLRNPPR